MVRSLALALMLFSGSTLAAEQQKSIPARFQGEWNSSLKDCGTALNDSRLLVNANRIHFYESGGPIRAVVTQGEFDLAVIAELSGEGETWISFRHFRLSADHRYITGVTDDDSGMVRYRCPKASK